MSANEVLKKYTASRRGAELLGLGFIPISIHRGLLCPQLYLVEKGQHQQVSVIPHFPVKICGILGIEVGDT